MKFKRKLSGILAVLMLLSSVSYGAGAAETEAVTENINTAETETTTDTENETDDTPVVKTLEFPVDPSGIEAQTTSTTGYSGACENVKDGVILHAFCWSFDTIKNNMADIAAAGYTAVQTSPPNACNKDNNGNLVLMGFDNTGHEDGYLGCWWWHYQPIDWKIGNYQLGTRQDYIDMCTEAHKYGIKIIADVLPNHTTPEFGAVCDDLVTAVGGTKNYNGNNECTGISKLYHTDGYTNLKNITTKTRYNYIYNASGGLPDVNTENPDFQVYYIKYLNDLVACGCDGLRYDTAKHIGVYSDPKDLDNEAKGLINDFWDVAAGTKSVTNSKGETVQFNKPDNFFIYGEILQDSGIPYDEYSKYMSLVASTYGAILRKRIADTTDGTYQNLDANTMKYWQHDLGGDKLVTWVESHDTYCNDHYDAQYSYGKSSYQITNDRIILGWAVIAAREKGTPLFFSRPAGAGDTYTDIEGVWGHNKLGAAGNDEYKCVEVAEVNKFRNAMVGQTETLSNPNSNKKMLQIDRGSLGTCIINLDEQSYNLSNTTTVADGTYIDSVWHEKHKNDPGFTEKTFVVSNGNITGTLEPCSVAVIYNKSSAVSVSAYSQNNEFTDNTLDVTLLVSGGNTGSYSVTVDGNTTSHDYINGQTIQIGNGVNVSDTSKEICLTLSAGGTTKTYTYYKMNPSDYTYVYFDNSSYNWCPPSVYIYNSNGSSNAVWPGEIMTAVPGTNYYKYRVPNNLKDGSVIFYSKSGDSNRYPADTLPGLSLGGKTMLFSANYSWTGFEPSTIYDTDNEPELEEPESENNGKKRYIYYFNSLGRTDTINNNTSTNIQAKLWKSSDSNSESAKYYPMSWSESLHCYYYKFAESEGYDRVQFKTGSSTLSQQVNISEGKVFAPVSESNSVEIGEWISPCNIYEHKVYFNNSSWSGTPKAYLSEGSRKSSASSGESMTSCGENLYSYTYYYTKLNDSVKTDYESVKFISGNDNNTTVDISLQHTNDSNKIMVYHTDGSCTEQNINAQGSISVTLHYSDSMINSQGNVTSTNVEKTFPVQKGIPESVVLIAISSVKGKNTYNELTGFTSQFNYVKELAKSYGANISPEKFVNASSYFSGIGVGYAASGNKWITYKSGNAEVSYKDLKPDLSNVDSIDVYLWAKAKTYKVDFIYPTSANETLTDFMDIYGNTMSFVNTKTVKLHSQKRYYNENIAKDTSTLINDMAAITGKDFDGWYCLDISNDKVNSYYKVSSFKDFNCRVTSDITLYAVFRSGSANRGATTTTSGVDDIDGSEGIKHRLNTILNIYNCEIDDKNITNVGIAYVKYGYNEEDYSISDVKDYLVRNVIEGSRTVNGTGNILNGTKTINYDYYTYQLSSSTKLTSLNRAQFVIEKNHTDILASGSFCNVIAFTTFKYNNTWYISDNYVIYRYDNSSESLEPTVMPNPV